VIDDRFPKAIEPGRMPGGIVIRVYRWADAAVMHERCIDSLDDIEAKADADYEAVDPAARTIVLIGYDGDSGEVLEPPMVVHR